MTIRKSEEWGRPSHAQSVVTVRRDSEISDWLTLSQSQSAELQVQGGDTWLSLGRPDVIRYPSVTWRLPFDAIRVSVGEKELRAYSSLVLRNPWWRGGVFTGDIWCVSLTGILRGRNISPRAHPNDGIIDVLRVKLDMTVRQRIQAWSRAKRGDHLPHYGIEISRLTTTRISSPRTMLLAIDGKRFGQVREIRLEVLPDEWFVSVPKGVTSDPGAPHGLDPTV
jgi:hypothetical protein